MEKLPEEKKIWRENEDGEMKHDGDCLFWECSLCTCGLIHALRRVNKSDEQYYDDFNEDWGKHESVQWFVVTKHFESDDGLPGERENDMTEEEAEELLDEIFGEDDEN